MSLVNSRFSALDYPESSPHHVLPSVKHLAIEVNNGNEEDIPFFLHSFPNIVTLLLDSDAACYMGVSARHNYPCTHALIRQANQMHIKSILSFPPLPYLTTLYRPPLRLAPLRFSSFLGYGPTGHNHQNAVYDQWCTGCQGWIKHAEAREQDVVEALAYEYPSLREVLIPRLVNLDWRNIEALSSDESMPVLDTPERMKGLDWIECMRRKSNVAVWLIESDDHGDCLPGCPRMASPSDLALEPGPTSSSDTDSPRRPFHVIRPRDHNEHLEFKRTGGTPVEDFPKIWWTFDENMAFLKATSALGDTSGIDAESHVQEGRESLQEKDDSQAKLFGRWDL